MRLQLCIIGLWVCFLTAVTHAQEYGIGGPLAGVNLPVAAAPPGIPPGYAYEGYHPEWELYPGSVEHWRAYWMKYTPTRSLFDRGTQLRNFVAPHIPVAPGSPQLKPESYVAPVYAVVRAGATRQEAQEPPATVLRVTANAPVFTLDLGQLPWGMYVVRVIGAVEAQHLQPIRKPLFLRLTVNDGLAGEVTTTRFRANYTDTFYCIAELYFHAPAAREYHVTLAVDEGSEVPLLLHNITVDDVLAGAVRRPIKTRRTLDLPAPPTQRKPSIYTPEQRLARDRALWELFPLLNDQGAGYQFKQSQPTVMFPREVTKGMPNLTAEQIEAQFGAWTPAHDGRGAYLFSDPQYHDAFIINKKLNLKYTVADFRARKPLPDPYPFKDVGEGIVTPDPRDPNKCWYWSPIADAVQYYRQFYLQNLTPRPDSQWPADLSEDRLRDQVLALIRYAYSLPALDSANYHAFAVHATGMYGRDRFHYRSAEAYALGHYGSYQWIAQSYDMIYDYIKDNQELAQSVGRFVPWVKQPSDLIMLMDVFGVQHTARRILHYCDVVYPASIVTVATVLGDNAITDPWMEWAFSRTFYYPMALAGIQDALISGTDPDGPAYGNGASSHYSAMEGARTIVAPIEAYLAAGGNPRYSLMDPQRYPKPLAHCYWMVRAIVAGWDFVRVGDVTGPDKLPGFMHLQMRHMMRDGWEWSGDPLFAFILKHYLGRQNETDAQWQAIETAAAQLHRAPWLDQPSRVLPNWAGILETGHEHDDPRFRRAAYLRTGLGYGHHHDDSLDLQFVAHGLPMLIDGGQRLGYTVPSDTIRRVHNVVEWDGRSQRFHAWITSLSDAPQARYVAARGLAEIASQHFSRQAALIDVDHSQPSQPLTIAQQYPVAKLPQLEPRANVTPGSYLFDCARTAAGTVNTFCFHAMADDAFTWNVSAERAVGAAPEGFDAGAMGPASVASPEHYLSIFGRAPESKFAGQIAGQLTATWRYSRDAQAYGTENRLLGINFDPDSPRKFVRLHLLEADGAQALRARAISKRMDYGMTHIYVQQRSSSERQVQSVFPAIIEAYVGEPLIQSVQALAVNDNETDHLRAVAVGVQLADGRQDVCFADGRPDKPRELAESGYRVAGEFAFHSQDKQGLRQAALTGGTLLASPLVQIKTQAARREGRIVRVDYRQRTLWLDQSWPSDPRGGNLVVGSGATWSAVPALDIAADLTAGAGTRIVTRLTAELYRSPINAIAAESREIQCSLGSWLDQQSAVPRTWVATDDDATRFWRVNRCGPGRWQVVDEKLPELADFGPAGVMHAWWYGPGDTVTKTTAISVRRVAPQVFEITGDVDVELAFPAQTLGFSTDQRQWRQADVPAQAGWSKLRLTAAQLTAGPLYLRVQP